MGPSAAALVLALLLAACGVSGGDGSDGSREPSPSSSGDAAAEVCADLGAIMADPSGPADGTTAGVLEMLEQVRRDNAAALEDDPELAAQLDAAIEAFRSHDLTDGGSIDGFSSLLATCDEAIGSTTLPPTTETTAPPRTPRPDAAERLQFRPVLQVSVAPSCAADGASTTTLPATCSAQTSPLPPGTIEATSVDRGLVYLLGPIGFDGSALASADATMQQSWAVSVRVRSEDVDAANAAFNHCYDGDATCPPMSGDGPGSIAIVFDGAVVSAPAVHGRDLADDSFSISGDFTQVEAEHLADSLFD